MQLQYFTLQDQGFTDNLCPLAFKAKKCWQATVAIPLAVNTKPVAKGAILILSWAIGDVVYFQGDHQFES